MELNVHRRHLNTEQKRDLIAELIKANPEKSNKQIADQAGVVSYPTVTKVREALEESGDVEKFTTSIDTKGRRQPRKKKSKAKASKPKSNPEEDDAEASADARKAQYGAADTPPPDPKADNKGKRKARTTNIVGGCVERVRTNVKATIFELLRRNSPTRRTQLERLFAALKEIIEDLEMENEEAKR